MSPAARPRWYDIGSALIYSTTLLSKHSSAVEDLASTERHKMKKMFVTLLILSLCHASVLAADKIRISTPADAAHFTMHLAQKRGFLKEEGFDAELIVISCPVANVALSNGDTDYFSGYGSALRAITQGLPTRSAA